MLVNQTMMHFRFELASLRDPALSDANNRSLFNTQTGPYVLLQQALLAQNQPNTALEVSERGRARAFVDLLSRRVSPALEQAIAISSPNLQQIKQISHEQNATLVQYSIASKPIEGAWEKWQQSELYIWVIKPTGEVAFRSVDLTAINPALNTLVNISRQSIGVRGRGSVPESPTQHAQQPAQGKKSLQQLYQVLIEPIADLLPTDPTAHIVFIPQEELFLVPFPALVDANGKFLIESHTISTSPSIQVLSLAQQLQNKSHNPLVIDPNQVLIVGNPTMPLKPPLPSLPGAEQEAIAKQFHRQPLLGSAAAEPAVVQRMATARLIHLATHGLLEYGDPKASGIRDMPGAIALAPAGQADGLLTSSELSAMTLHADLGS